MSEKPELSYDNIKAVVFDFDDTLVGTHAPIWNLHRYIARNYYGVELDDATLLAHWGKPIDELARHYYGAEDTAAAVAIIQNTTRNFPKETFPHTSLILQELKLAKKVLGIVSATLRPILTEDLYLAGINKDLISYVQTAEDSEYHKPNPRVFDPMLIWMARLGIEKSEILYVGDGLQDMYAANKAKIKFLGVATGLVDNAKFESLGAESISDLSLLSSRIGAI